VNRDAKTQSALIALARTRRMQRAVAHAYIHRDAPLPTLRLSLGFMVATARTTDDAGAHGQRMTVLGTSRDDDAAYIVEQAATSDADDELPIVYRLFLHGPRAGHLVPIHAWYEHAADAREIRARIAAIATTLDPVAKTTTEAWMLSTRVVHRRALRVGGQDAPIRKFALQLRVEPVSGHGAIGHATVTAYLSPHATLADVWAVPGVPGMAIARVTYAGIPSGVGLSKDTCVLLGA
jgi:hypothetical protein